MSAAGGDPDPLLELLAGKVRAQAVSTAAHLGLADLLDAGPLSLEELARRSGCAPRPLGSLLGFLSGLGLFASEGDERFALTELGRRLRSDALGPLAAFVGSSEQWDPWSRLRDALGEGPCAFERTFGEGLYAYLARHPEAARRYDAAIEAFTRHEAAALLAAHPFDGIRRVVDVGGGQGALLAEILAHSPATEGVLFDLPHVVEAARDRFGDRFGPRLEFVPGDFFAGLPGGADVYLLKHVLHNWDDGRASELLARCRRGLAPGGRVLVVDAVLAPGSRADAAALLDLEMLVLTGGGQRRKPQWRRLFQRAGLVAQRLSPLGTGAWLLVAAPAPDQD